MIQIQMNQRFAINPIKRNEDTSEKLQELSIARPVINKYKPIKVRADIVDKVARLLSKVLDNDIGDMYLIPTRPTRPSPQDYNTPEHRVYDRSDQRVLTPIYALIDEKMLKQITEKDLVSILNVNIIDQKRFDVDGGTFDINVVVTSIESEGCSPDRWPVTDTEFQKRNSRVTKREE